MAPRVLAGVVDWLCGPSWSLLQEGVGPGWAPGAWPLKGSQLVSPFVPGQLNPRSQLASIQG